MTAQRDSPSPTPTATSLPIYPKYCHIISDTWKKWCPLRATDVYALKTVNEFGGQDIYHHLNHPIRWVRLTGVIVSAEEISSRMIYTLDDSSGQNIELVCRAPIKTEPLLPQPQYTNTVLNHALYTTVAFDTHDQDTDFKSPDGPILRDIDVGSVVKAKGSIGVFRGQRQIQLKKIEVLGDTNAEVKCWREVFRFRRDVLDKPWVLTVEEKDECREMVERQEREAREEEELKRRAEDRNRKLDLKRRIREKDRELMREKKKKGGGKAGNDDVVVKERRKLTDKEKELKREKRRRLAQEEAERKDREFREKRLRERQIGVISKKKYMVG